MEELTEKDVRRMLKTFGVKADQAIMSHLARFPGKEPLRLRITLEDLTEYGGDLPGEPLHVVVEDIVHRA